jgi:hypothetical protein
MELSVKKYLFNLAVQLTFIEVGILLADDGESFSAGSFLTLLFFTSMVTNIESRFNRKRFNPTTRLRCSITIPIVILK